MSYLKKFARNIGKGRRDKVLTARITEDLYEAFNEHCNQLGLSISEAISLLIDKEIQESQGVYKSNTVTPTKEIHKASPVANNVVDSAIKSISPDSKPNTKSIQNKPSTNTGGKRFVTTPWQVDNLLPCPMCNNWYDKSNYSRHCKTHHSRTTQEMLTEYKDKADVMVEEKLKD